MKILWSILRIIGALILIAAIGVGGTFIYASIDKLDTYFLKGSKLSNYALLTQIDSKPKSEEQNKDLGIYVHRVQKGPGVILAYRWYSNGSVLIIDDEGFEKLTIWIDKFPGEQKSFNFDLLNEKEIQAVYTRGGAAWPRAACSGYLKKGKVSIVKNEVSVDVTVDSTLTPSGVGSYDNWCQPREVKLHFSAKEIMFHELTTWLGLPGNHPYDETYRKNRL